MTVGSMIVKRDPPMKCSRCGREIPKGATAWYTKGKRGYWCQDCQDDWVQKNTSGMKVERKVYGVPGIAGGEIITITPEQTTTTAAEQNAPRLSSSESDIAKGHRENMESAKLTRDMIVVLSMAIQKHGEIVQGLTGEIVNLRSQVQLLREKREG